MISVVQNCWFCNLDSSVWFTKKNSWTCQHCNQYNGFNEDGDYNKEIKAMHQVKKEATSKRKQFHIDQSNGLCDHCNYYQQVKIEKLAEFKPKNEENFDAEIKSYKEYLEKIYEICVECKSKVNFEITKQNGILKQYFLNLGNFDYFYEKPQSSTLNVHNKAHSVVGSQQVYTLNTNTPYFQGKLNLFLSVASYLVIFILASLILAYNEYNDLMINELNENSTLAISLLFHAEQIINQSFIIKSRSLGTFFLGSYFDNSSEQVFTYFNQSLPFLLVAIYPLSCLLLIIYKKSGKSFDFISTFLIWLVDLMLVISNRHQYSSLLKSNLTQQSEESIELESINLGYSLLISMPLIQAIILNKLFAFIISLLLHKKKPAKFTPLKHKLLNKVNQNSSPVLANSGSPFNSNSPLNPVSSARENVQFNYASITPKSYTLMKYIESDNNKRANSATNLNFNQQVNYFSKSNSCELIKPARFSPSEKNINYIKAIRKNSIEDSIGNSELDDSSESSIISGLTNLYLNKTKEKARSTLNLFETEKNLINRPKLPNINMTMNGSSYHSFYQETPSRSLISLMSKKNY